MSHYTTIYRATYANSMKRMKFVSIGTFIFSCVAVPVIIAKAITKEKNLELKHIEESDKQPSINNNILLRSSIAGISVITIAYIFTALFHSFAKRYVIRMDKLASSAVDSPLRLHTLGFFGQTISHDIYPYQMRMLSQSSTGNIYVPHLNRHFFIQFPQIETKDQENQSMTSLFSYLQSRKDA